MAAVEFAMVFLLMMTWIFGIMEVARAFWTYQIIQEVAVQGARCMGIISTNCSVGGTYDATTSQNYMVTLAGNLGLTLPIADIVLTRPTNCAGTTGFSQVTISYNFQTLMPMLIPSLSAIQLTASSCAYNTR
jgi:Flp pilus assembly protein TadG